MRLLLIAERFMPQRGGLAVSTRRLAMSLASRGVEVHLFVLTGEVDPGDLVSGRMDNIFIHRLGRFNKFDRSYMVACRAIELLHRRHPFDAVMGVYLMYAGYLAAMEARMLDLPCLTMARGNDVDREIWRPENVPLLMATLKWSTAVGCVSEELVKKCRELGAREGVYFTPNSVDSDLFSPGESDPELKISLGLGKGRVVGFSGEMRFKKGMHHFVEIAGRISESNPGTHFMLLGGVRNDDRDDYDRLLRDEPGLENVLVEIPYVENQTELAKYYRLMDFLFIPSLWEGMPNAALEAMSCEVPVVASTAGGLADLVDAPRSGYLFPPGDYDAGAEALTAALALPDNLRRKMGRLSRERVIRKFSPKIETDRVFEILEKIIAENASEKDSPPVE